MAGRVGQQKEKDFDLIQPRISFNDMPEERKKACIKLCIDSYKMKHDGDFKYYKDMAAHIKKELDTREEGSWHVIVGTHFGSFVTYEVKSIILFWLEHIGFLIFKHG